MTTQSARFLKRLFNVPYPKSPWPGVQTHELLILEVIGVPGKLCIA
jgi:hypothetical protein